MAKVSMKDVALHAGVSIATVSHVINHTRNVSPETAQKVNDSIEALHFRPDPVARNFKTGRSNMIAFVVPDIANSFYATLISAIETTISEAGYQLLIINTKEDPETELRALKKLESGLVDAIILATSQFEYSALESVIFPQIPHLFIDRRLASAPYDSAVVCIRNVMMEGVEYLIAKGHKKIGFIAGIDYPYLMSDRIDGYITAMKKHDLYDPDLLIHSGIMGLSPLLNLDKVLEEKDCTALICGNNVNTISAYNVLMNKGIIPGKDIELIGFRESEIIQYALKSMNLIVQPVVSMGVSAARQILHRIEHPDDPIREIILEASFIRQDDVPPKFYLPY